MVGSIYSFLLRANPAFHLPPQWGFLDALKTVRLVASFSSFPDESSQAAHLILPTHPFLESWGDYEPYAGVRSILQPVMGPMFNTRLMGEILLSLGRNLKGAKAFPEKDFYEVMRRSWVPAEKKGTVESDSESAWQEALRQGGLWPSDALSTTTSSKPRSAGLSKLGPVSLSFRIPPNIRPGRAQSTIRTDSLSFISYPTVQFFDGRMANRPFLQELPDPMTSITWGGWVELHPETAATSST